MWGRHIGALSRTDNRTEVCSPCGTEEALQQMNGHPSPQDEWPLNRGRALDEQVL